MVSMTLSSPDTLPYSPEASHFDADIEGATDVNKQPRRRPHCMKYSVPILLCIIVILSSAALGVRKALRVAWLTYYSDHAALALLIFVGAAIAFWVLVHRLRLTAMWTVGCFALSIFMLARVMRDNEKLSWSWNDYLNPVAVLFFVVAVFAIDGRAVCANKRCKLGMFIDNRKKYIPSDAEVGGLTIALLTAILTLPLSLLSMETYFMVESAICVILFVGVASLHYVLESIVGLTGYLICAFMTGQMFYLGREVRDFQQSILHNDTEWDVIGFMAPFLAVFVAFACLQFTQILVSWKFAPRLKESEDV